MRSESDRLSIRKLKANPEIRVLVTGGPTRAWLDEVRFLSNVSSGEMAFEICRALVQRGISVALVSGPTTQPFETLKLARWKRVETAEEMNTAVQALCRSFRPTHAVFSAAVLDFTPASRARGKVPSSRKSWTVKLKPTPKIVDEVGRRFPKIARVGFKLEPERKKTSPGKSLVRRKGYQALVLNYLSEIGSKGHKTELFLPGGKVVRSTTKRETARALVRALPQLGSDRELE